MNGALVGFVPAVEASLINLLIAVAARHDGIVRGAFALAWSYRLHQLTNHLGQLHRATAIAATVWFTVALAATPGAIGAVALAILVAMMWTARDRVRPGRHETVRGRPPVRRLGGAGDPGRPGDVERGIAALVLLVAVIALVAHPWLGVRRVRLRGRSASPTRS